MNIRKLPSLILPAMIAAILASPALAQQQDTQSDAKGKQAKQQTQSADKAADASAAKANDAAQADAKDKSKGKDKKKSKSDDPTYEPEEDDDR
jgi:hypothetical protein